MKRTVTAVAAAVMIAGSLAAFAPAAHAEGGQIAAGVAGGLLGGMLLVFLYTLLLVLLIKWMFPSA